MTAAAAPVDDPVGAFCRDNHAALAGAETGPLAGLTCGVKDVFHIAGQRTGFGHPDWLATHPPAERTAPIVERLLAAGARMVGRTITDELAYSLSGENMHYGTPVNSRAPGRVAGGSSSGSAAAVTAGLVDFAIGTDCGGSVRLPASYCGLYGIRPTFGRVSLEGAIPFTTNFDAAGWFADDADVFLRVGRVLLAEAGEPSPLHRVTLATDAFALVEERVRAALAPAVERVTAAFGGVEEATVSPEGLESWMGVFRTLQAAEIWANHGAWIRRVKPQFGRGVRERMEQAAKVTEAEVAECRPRQQAIKARLEAMLGDGDVLCLPTSPRIAPLRDTPTDDLEIRYRYQAFCLLCIAGLAGLPQVSLPLAELDGCPLGLSLVGPPGSDMQLLALAKTLATA